MQSSRELEISVLVLQCYVQSYVRVLNATEIGAHKIHLNGFKSITVTSVNCSHSSFTVLIAASLNFRAGKMTGGFFVTLGKM